MTSVFTDSIRTLKRPDLLVLGSFCFLFAYISLVPFYYLQEQSLTEGVPTISPLKYGPFVVVGLVGLFWAVECVRGRRAWIRSPINPFLGGYVVASLCSLIGAEYASVGLAKWLYYHGTGGLLCLLLLQYCTTWEVVKVFVAALCAISCIFVLYTLMSTSLGGDPIWGQTQTEFNPYYTTQRAVGPSGHTVATAGYAMMVFPVIAWFALGLERLRYRLLWALVGLLCPVVVVLTQSRGALLATGLCCVLMVPWLKARWPRRYPPRRLCAGLVIAGSMLAIAAWKLGVLGFFDQRLDEIGQRWRELLNPHSVTVENEGRVYRYGSTLEYTERFRIFQYKEVARHLDDHPLLGVGFGVYSRIFERGKFEHTNPEIWTVGAHTTENMYLLYLVETGWVGLIARLLLQGAVLLVIFRSYRRAADLRQRELLLAVLVSQSGLAFNMLTWDMLAEPTMRMTSWILTGLALATARCAKAQGA